MTLGDIVAESPFEREITLQMLGHLLAARTIRIAERARPLAAALRCVMRRSFRVSRSASNAL